MCVCIYIFCCASDGNTATHLESVVECGWVTDGGPY